MTCPVCRSVIPGLACENCGRRESLAAFVERQQVYVPKLLDGTLELLLVWIHGRRHFLLFEERRHTWCGLKAERKYHREPYMDYGRSFYCPECLAVFDRLAREVAA